jgi:hypothetical protein
MKVRSKLNVVRLLKVVAVLAVGLGVICGAFYVKMVKNTSFTNRTNASSFSMVSKGQTMEEVLDVLGPPLFFYFLKDGGYWRHEDGDMVKKYKQYECILHYSKPIGDGDYLRREVILYDGVVVFIIAGPSG